MGCPFMTRPPERPTEYPYEAMYRPWSWIISSCSNLFLFAAVFVILYVIYRRKWGKSTQQQVTYRRVVVNQTNAQTEGKVNAVVIGGNGCLGKSLVKCLLEDGEYRVHSLDLLIPDEEQRNGEVCSYIQTDITSEEDLAIALKGMDAVFHTASITPMFELKYSEDGFRRINITGTENIIEACKQCGVKRLIYTSSNSVIMSKDPKQSIDGADETYPLPKNPMNIYVASKMAAEQLVRAANGKGGLLTCALRPAGLIGCDNPLVKHYVSDRTIIPGDGSYRYTMVPVDAASRGHILAEKSLCRDGEKSIAVGKAYNLCSEDKILYVDFASHVEKDADCTLWGQPAAAFMPLWQFSTLTYFNTFVNWLTGWAPLGKTLAPMGLDYLREHTFTSALIHQELGWEELPPWKDIIKACVKEFKEQAEQKKEK